MVDREAEERRKKAEYAKEWRLRTNRTKGSHYTLKQLEKIKAEARAEGYDEGFERGFERGFKKARMHAVDSDTEILIYSDTHREGTD